MKPQRQATEILTDLKNSYKKNTWKNLSKKMCVSTSTLYRWRKNNLLGSRKINEVKRVSKNRKIKTTTNDLTDELLNNLSQISDQSPPKDLEYFLVMMNFATYKDFKKTSSFWYTLVVNEFSKLDTMVQEYIQIITNLGMVSGITYKLLRYKIKTRINGNLEKWN